VLKTNYLAKGASAKIQGTLGEEKDEFEYAVSWRRAFSEVYEKMRWLDSFALMNEIIAKNVVEKAVKKFFADPNQPKNALRIYLEQEIAKLSFMQRKEA